MKEQQHDFEISRHPRRSELGLSLLEVTSTIILLTALALSIGLLVVPMARQSRLNREISTANSEAKKTLERIQSTPFSEILITFPNGEEQNIPALVDGKLIVSYEDTTADP